MCYERRRAEACVATQRFGKNPNLWHAEIWKKSNLLFNNASVQKLQPFSAHPCSTRKPSGEQRLRPGPALRHAAGLRPSFGDTSQHALGPIHAARLHRTGRSDADPIEFQRALGFGAAAVRGACGRGKAGGDRPGAVGALEGAQLSAVVNAPCCLGGGEGKEAGAGGGKATEYSSQQVSLAYTHVTDAHSQHVLRAQLAITNAHIHKHRESTRARTHTNTHTHTHTHTHTIAYHAQNALAHEHSRAPAHQ
jgi:hypothetical protein